MCDEPRNHPRFLLVMGLVSVGAVPFWFVGRETVFLFGFPLWFWSSMAFTAALAGLTAWGILKLWKDEELD